MNTIKLKDGNLSAKMSVEEVRASGNTRFGVHESELSGLLCQITNDVSDYSYCLAQGDKFFAVGVDNDGDVVIAIIKDEEYDNPLIQCLNDADFEVL